MKITVFLYLLVLSVFPIIFITNSIADGETLVSGSKDGTVLVWDIATIIQDIDSSK